MPTIPGNVFEALTKNYSLIDSDITEVVRISKTSLVRDKITKIEFVNCSFHSIVIVENIMISSNISFNRCNFRMGLTIKNVDFVDDITQKDDNPCISIENCKVSGNELLFEDFYFPRDIVLMGDNNSITELAIKKITTDSRHIRIEKYRLSNLNLTDNVIDHFSVINSVINSFISSGNKYRILKCFHNTFNSKTDLRFDKINESLLFESDQIKGIFHILCLTAENGCLPNVSFVRVKSTAELLINSTVGGVNKNYSSGYNEVTIHDSEFQKGIKVIGESEKDHIPIINELKVTYGYDSQGDLSFSDFNVKSFLISGVLTGNRLDFANISFGDIVFQSFTNNGSVKFIDIYANTEDETNFKIVDSNLGKMELMNFSFINFTNVLRWSNTLGQLFTQS